MRMVVVGLGRLGSPLAAMLAAAGATVVGVDTSDKTILTLNAGRAPVNELGLQDVMERARPHLSATSDYGAAVADADISFVVVPTPSNEDGLFSLVHVQAAVSGIGRALRGRRGNRHVVVITSTVMPGSTLGPIREALEKSSGLTVGRDVGLCYSPEFIALGSVIADLAHPDMILVGESDTASGDVLLSAVRTLTGDATPVARMDPTSAEVAKLAVNTFVTTKISYANMLAEICEQLPGADARQVTSAIGMDSRIGAKYLQPGPPYGGPCFPRDNAALAAVALSLGGRADIAEATDAINRRQLDRVMCLLKAHARQGDRVAILGLSYKAGTPVRDESFGVNLAIRCVAEGFHVTGWDPFCREGSIPTELQSVALTASLADSLRLVDVAVVATPWAELTEVPTIVRRTGRPRMLVDCWRQFDGVEMGSDVCVTRLGQGPTRPLGESGVRPSGQPGARAMQPVPDGEPL